MKPLPLILLIVMNCLWAVAYSAFKALSPWLDEGGVATLRFGLPGAILLVCWPWLPGLAPRGRLRISADRQAFRTNQISRTRDRAAALQCRSLI